MRCGYVGWLSRFDFCVVKKRARIKVTFKTQKQETMQVGRYFYTKNGCLLGVSINLVKTVGLSTVIGTLVDKSKGDRVYTFSKNLVDERVTCVQMHVRDDGNAGRTFRIAPAKNESELAELGADPSFCARMLVSGNTVSASVGCHLECEELADHGLDAPVLFQFGSSGYANTGLVGGLLNTTRESAAIQSVIGIATTPIFGGAFANQTNVADDDAPSAFSEDDARKICQAFAKSSWAITDKRDCPDACQRVFESMVGLGMNVIKSKGASMTSTFSCKGVFRVRTQGRSFETKLPDGKAVWSEIVAVDGGFDPKDLERIIDPGSSILPKIESDLPKMKGGAVIFDVGCRCTRCTSSRGRTF